MSIRWIYWKNISKWVLPVEGSETESHAVVNKHFADEHHADALTFLLGGKEWSEQVTAHVVGYSETVVLDRHREWVNAGDDADLSFAADRLVGVFNQIDLYLFELNAVNMHSPVFLQDFSCHGDVPTLTFEPSKRLHRANQPVQTTAC
jgi:hypothetical protein